MEKGRWDAICNKCGKKFRTHSTDRSMCYDCKPKCRERHFFNVPKGKITQEGKPIPTIVAESIAADKQVEGAIKKVILTPEQILRWRKVLAMTHGAACVSDLSNEDIQKLRDEMQETLDVEVMADASAD